MKYYWIFGKDERHNNWLLYRDDMERGRLLRDRYAALPCVKCGKVDEQAAVRSGLDGDIAIRSQREFVQTSDGFICVSRRVKDLCEAQRIAGWEFIPIPGDSRYWLCLPTTVVPVVDEATCGMEFHNPCTKCGRHKEAILWPGLASMKLPAEANDIVLPRVAFENGVGRKFIYLFSEPTFKMFKSAKVTGLQPMEAL